MTNIVKEILRSLVFVFFIIIPFWLLRDVISSAIDNNVYGMFMRFISFKVIFIVIILMSVFNIVGFCILRKNKYWNLSAFLYLCLQAVVSAIFLFLSITTYDWGYSLNQLKTMANALNVSLSQLMFIETLGLGNLYYKLTINVMCLFNIITILPVAIIRKIKNKKFN